MLRIGIGLGLIPTAARPEATTAPVNVVKPFFDGILTQGQAADANPGAWTGLPSPNFDYDIKRSGVTVSTDPAYVWTAADVAAGASAMSVDVTATNDVGPTTETSDPVTIAAPLQISGSAPGAIVGAAYSFIPTRTGGHGPFAFALDGTLPSGLSFNTSSGTISGTPVASGSATLGMAVMDADGLTDELEPFDLPVSSAAGPWSPADLAGGYLFDFDFDDSASHTMSGSNITAIASKAGLGSYTNGTGIPKAANAIGSKSVATFTTIGLAGNADANLLLRGVNRVSAAILIKPITGSNGGMIGFSAASPNFSRFHVSYGTASGGAVPVILQLRRNDGDSVVTITTTDTVPLGSWSLITAVYDPTTASARIRINGKDSKTGTVATSGPLPYTASNESAIGRQITDQNLNGQLAQAIGMTFTDLDTIERLEGYVAHRWVLQASVLDVAHPYRSIAPTSAPTDLESLDNDMGVWGASNISGNQDGTGVTMETVLAPLFTNPQKFLGGLPMKGVGGNTSAQVLARIQAATAAEKAAPTILQIGGSNDFVLGGVTVSDAFETWQDMLAAFGHEDIMTWTALFPTNGAAGTYSWCKCVDFYRRLAAEAPGSILPMWAYAQDPAVFPPITSQDLIDQTQSCLPATYRYDGDHCNAAGYTVQATEMLLPAVLAHKDDAAPYLPWQEIYSQESTNQTNGGLVGKVGYFGDLTGASVAFETPDSDFAIAIVGDEIRITRASATVLKEDYYDRTVRLTKGNRVKIDTVRILLGTPAGATAINRVTHNGKARYAQWEGFAGVADGGKFSMVVDLELLDAAQDGTSLRLTMPNVTNEGLLIQRTTGNALSVTLTDASAANAVAITASGGAGGAITAANGRRWLFISVDIAAGVGGVWIDTVAGTTITTAPGAGASTIALSGAHRRLSQVDNVNSTTVPKANIGTWWEAAGYIDFGQAANRDLFRTEATKVAKAIGTDGVVTIAAGAGAGATVTPYLFMKGNAADRYMGRNDGSGVTGSGATRAGELFFVNNPTARLTTV